MIFDQIFTQILVKKLLKYYSFSHELSKFGSRVIKITHFWSRVTQIICLSLFKHHLSSLKLKIVNNLDVICLKDHIEIYSIFQSTK